MGGPCRNIAITFSVEKLEWCGYPSVKNCEDMYNRLDRILAYDGRMDGQTDGQTDGHLATA